MTWRDWGWWGAQAAIMFTLGLGASACFVWTHQREVSQQRQAIAAADAKPSIGRIVINMLHQPSGETLRVYAEPDAKTWRYDVLSMNGAIAHQGYLSADEHCGIPDSPLAIACVFEWTHGGYLEMTDRTTRTRIWRAPK